MSHKKCTSKYHKGDKPIPLSAFGKDKNRKDGLHSHCKSCRRIARDKWAGGEQININQRASERYYEHHEENKAKNRKIAAAYKKKRGIPWALLMSVKSRANKRGLEFNLTEEDLQIPVTCPVFNIPLVQEVGKRGPDYPTVDRIDNTKGYTKDNIRIISWRANNLKGTATLDELVLLGEDAKRYKIIMEKDSEN